MKSHYEVLGVGVDADLDDLRRAYYGKAQILHPDRYATASDADWQQAEAQMKAVNAAWRTLRDPATRRRYDSELGLANTVDEDERPRVEGDPEELSDPDRRSSGFGRGARVLIAVVLIMSIAASLIAVVSQSDDHPGGWTASEIAALRFAALNSGMSAPQAECFVEAITSRYAPSDGLDPPVIQQVADACR